MRKIRVPFFSVNPKNYLFGEDCLNLAKAADRAAEETGLDLLFSCPFADIRLIKQNTNHLLVTAQHMDPVKPGRGMGYVLPESLKEAGADVVFLNHAEHPMTVSDLYATINRAKEVGINTMVCADSVAEGLAIARMSPDILLCEPTDLIGTGTVADDGYITEVISRIREADPNILILIASGVTTADDVYKVIMLGADGTGGTSGIVKAPDPGGRIMEWAEAVAKAAKERQINQ